MGLAHSSGTALPNSRSLAAAMMDRHAELLLRFSGPEPVPAEQPFWCAQLDASNTLYSVTSRVATTSGLSCSHSRMRYRVWSRRRWSECCSQRVLLSVRLGADLFSASQVSHLVVGSEQQCELWTVSDAARARGKAGCNAW
jgi:hypothetical protein